MNREILFRGKARINYEDKNIKEDDWVYGNYLYIPFSRKHFIYLSNEKSYDDSYWVEIKKDTLCQLVGEYKIFIDEDCTDLIKSKIIFERDILRVIDETPIGDIELVGVISYDISSSCYMIDFPNEGMSKPFDCYLEGVLLLGNEIDNPELLEIEGKLIKR